MSTSHSNNAEVDLQAHVDTHCRDAVSSMHRKGRARDYLLASQVFQSEKACHTYFILNGSPPALNFMSACSLRTTHTPSKENCRVKAMKPTS